MNIFEFLGLDSEHRKVDKVTQLVKHLEEVPESKKFNDVYMAQPKYDGLFCHVVVKDVDDIAFFTRTGKQFSCTDYLLNSLLHKDRDKQLVPGVYMAELCCDNCSLEELSGIFNPNRVKMLTFEQHEHCLNSYLMFHDYVTLQAFIDGYSFVKAEVRYGQLIKNLKPIEFSSDHDIVVSDLLLTEEDMISYAERRIADGEEGAVFKACNCGWEAGHKGFRSMKIVKDISYDLECIGVEEGTGKYSGKVANLIFKWRNGKEIKAMLGKGWSHYDAKEMLEAHRVNTLFNDHDLLPSPLGKIFTVYALQESSKGKLRLPKVGELRYDKTEADV